MTPAPMQREGNRWALARFADGVPGGDQTLIDSAPPAP